VQKPGIPVIGAWIVLKRRVECDTTFIEFTECSILTHLPSKLQGYKTRHYK